MKKVLVAVERVLTAAPIRAFIKKENKPIKKVLAGGIASAVVFLAHRAGIHVPAKTIDDAASSFAGIVVAYLVR